MRYSFPTFTLPFNALHFSAFLLPPARHSFACCTFPPFRRIYSVVPRQWKKASLSCIYSQPKFCRAPYLQLLRTIASLHPARASTLPLSRASPALHAHVRIHAHVTEERGNCDFVTRDEQRRRRSFIREKLYSFTSSSTLRDLWYNTSEDTAVLVGLSAKAKLVNMNLVKNFVWYNCISQQSEKYYFYILHYDTLNLFNTKIIYI